YGAAPSAGSPQSPQSMQPQRNNGMSIASLVLSLVNVIPCFWLAPIPALLGVIFGFVGRGQMKRSGSDKGKGLGIAGITIGIVFLVLAAVLIAALVVNRNNCDPTVELC
ncbi:MAG: DUF4190 domain-containing protein, partial [Actinomycetota bacterium]